MMTGMAKSLSLRLPRLLSFRSKLNSVPVRGLAVLLSCPLLAGSVAAEPVKAPAILKISENHRYLVTGDGQPFFWLGDTAWELFHRLTRGEAADYFQRRAAQGFTVAQIVALAEFDGLKTPNANGDLPLIDLDPARPAVKDGPDNDYWDQVDAMVRMGNEAGLVIGFLPTWGDKWHAGGGAGPKVFDPANAAIYGKWLGSRYKDASLVWILGGDRDIGNDGERATLRAMARGLKEGDGGKHLITFHPRGGRGSADDLHDEPWLDFNLRQNGHNSEYESYRGTLTDYRRAPVKPVIDGEPIYEDHPVSFQPKERGHSVAADVRRAFYWDFFNGACGHTYGHHSIWQFYDTGREPVNSPLLPWRAALEQPGAAQMGIGKALMLKRPFQNAVPDPALIVDGNPPTAVPGAGIRRMTALRDVGGAWAMVYCPVPRPFSVNTSAIPSKELRVWWFDPRTGKATDAGKVENKPGLIFSPPNLGEFLDCVLVLDNPDANCIPLG